MTTYRVIGTKEVLGVSPGKTFEADLSPEQEAALIQGGHIQESKTQKPDAKVSDTTAPSSP